MNTHNFMALSVIGSLDGDVVQVVCAMDHVSWFFGWQTTLIVFWSLDDGWVMEIWHPPWRCLRNIPVVSSVPICIWTICSAHGVPLWSLAIAIFQNKSKRCGMQNNSSSGSEDSYSSTSFIYNCKLPFRCTWCNAWSSSSGFFSTIDSGTMQWTVFLHFRMKRANTRFREIPVSNPRALFFRGLLLLKPSDTPLHLAELEFEWCWL